MDIKKLILEAPDLKREPIEVPEWGVTVYVGVMSGHDRNKWSESAFDSDGSIKTDYLRARLLVYCLCDSDGRKVFNESPEDMEALENKSATVLTRLFIAAKRLNGMGSDAVDDAEKN